MGKPRAVLGVPQGVKDATAEYRAEQDLLADFLAEKCLKDPQAWGPSGVLFKVYSDWCDGNGEKPLTKTGFGLRLTERGFVQAKGAKGVRIWRGLRMAQPTPLSLHDAGRDARGVPSA